MRQDIEEAIQAERMNSFDETGGLLLAGAVTVAALIGVGAVVWRSSRSSPVEVRTGHDTGIRGGELHDLANVNVFVTPNAWFPADSPIGKQHPLPTGYKWVESPDRAAGVLGQKRVDELSSLPVERWRFWTAQDTNGKVLDLPWLRVQ